jgi:hypothetical protein
MQEVRKDVVDYIRRQLFGPADGTNEEIIGKPFWQYLCGILFPSDVVLDDLGESDEPDAEGIGEEMKIEDPSIGMAYQALPSSMGISFFISGTTSIECRVEGAIYEHGSDGKWARTELAGPDSPKCVELECPRVGKQDLSKKKIFDGRAELATIFRPREGGHLVTVSLVNRNPPPRTRSIRNHVPAMLFQCRFAVVLKDGSIGEYPTILRYARHEEDEELALVYRNRKTFGIGHGCAAVWDWNTAQDGLREIRADPLPVVEVKGLTNNIDLPAEAASVLSLQWLASEDTPREQLAEALRKFADCYDEWIEKQATLADKLEPREAATRIVARQQAASDRIRRGIDVLTGDGNDDVLAAFRISQEAMLKQFVWSAKSKNPCNLGEADTGRADIWSDEYSELFKWRPFQLAFQLLALESLAVPESSNRETLDLLWFPTGGGKTEAYLALASFEIALRRRRYMASGYGTTVLMRYTLRLLTSQQFERCATLISVLETMRKQRPELCLGDDPISLGLWVGALTTPNQLNNESEKFPGARQLFEERVLHDLKPENPFQLLKCPCCGTRIVPERHSPRNHYGLKVDQYEFRMFCPDENCELHEHIPVSVVDDDLYQRSPTILIGTIDKFARMAWDARSRVFLGMGTDNLPPSLVIQDELHLITGPLGTIAGTYEAAIYTVIKRGGIEPKYLAATATIQRASEQSTALYARDSCVFPARGLSSDDSFFSREEVESPGRQFIGAMGNGLYSSLTSLIQISAACAGAVEAVPEDVEIPGRETKARDTYWTQVIYHNSRQELGKTTTMLRDDVYSRLRILQPDESRRRKFEIIQELSANLKGAEVSTALEQLEVEWPALGAIDVLACTNMISVGVDVGRLGLMIVKGQPKSTSEYIQATSRIGREPERPPGVVVALYSANRPRDRSHYESFQSYHQSLYRAVEPVTVTPFAPPAQDRTLHAAIVLAVRAVKGWLGTEDARDFDESDVETKDILNTLKSRLLKACRDDEREDVMQLFEEIVGRWQTEASAAGNTPPLTFDGGQQFRELLGNFSDHSHGIWRTLNSMRHVDGETPFQVRGEE